jgi:hypothetical protein
MEKKTSDHPRAPIQFRKTVALDAILKVSKLRRFNGFFPPFLFRPFF